MPDFCSDKENRFRTLGFYTVACLSCLAGEKTPAVSPFDRFFEPGLQDGTRTLSV